jgi:hypothetical protein
MFGMLDYRAHKLYLIIFGIPNLILWVLSVFGIPYLVIQISDNYTSSPLFLFLMSLVVLFISELLLLIIVLCLSKIYMFIFGLFVDIIPANKRNKEEAQLVVWGGIKVANLIDFNKKKPADWTYEDLDNLTKGFFNSFFKEKIIERFEKIKNYYINNPEIEPSESEAIEYLKANNMQMTIIEKIITNPDLRTMAIRYSFFIYLLLVHI